MHVVWKLREISDERAHGLQTSLYTHPRERDGKAVVKACMHGGCRPGDTVAAAPSLEVASGWLLLGFGCEVWC